MKAARIKMVSMSLTQQTPHTIPRQPGAFEVSSARQPVQQTWHRVPDKLQLHKRNQKYPSDEGRQGLGGLAWYVQIATGRGEEIMSELISKEDYEDLLKWHYETEKNETDMLMRPTCAPHYYRIVPQMNKLAEEGDKLERRTLKFSTGGSGPRRAIDAL
jgi:hypothetical protein